MRLYAAAAPTAPRESGPCCHDSPMVSLVDRWTRRAALIRPPLQFEMQRLVQRWQSDPPGSVANTHSPQLEPPLEEMNHFVSGVVRHIGRPPGRVRASLAKFLGSTTRQPQGFPGPVRGLDRNKFGALGNVNRSHSDRHQTCHIALQKML